MSRGSMKAMSPGRSRLVRFFVRRSSRAVPVTPGAVSVARPRRRVPMRMAAMVPRGAESPDPTRSGDGPITHGERHRGSSASSGRRPGVAAVEPDRPVTSVTAVTAGASASRSTATVLADDLVEELADRRDPAAAAAAAVERAVAGTSAPDDVVPDSPRSGALPADDPAEAQVLALPPRPPGSEQGRATPVPGARPPATEPPATEEP